MEYAVIAGTDMNVSRIAQGTVIELAERWVLDQAGITAALSGARHPAELDAVAGVLDWHLDTDTRAAIDQMLRQTVASPIGPEFMAPPIKSTVAAKDT